MKRSAIRPKVDPDRSARRAHVRAAVFDRDEHRCILRALPGFPCHGPLTPHHRRKAGAAGAYTVANLATLCAGHNDGLEADGELAELVGREFPELVVREGDPEWDGLSARAARKSCPTCEGTRFDVDGGPCAVCRDALTR